MPTSKPIPSEAQIQRAICQALDLLGIEYSETDAARVWDRHGRARRGRVKAGWPDITLILPGGRAGFIETKARRGRVRSEQRACHRRLEAAGASVLVAWSLDDAVEWLRGCGVAVERVRGLVR